MRPQLVSPAVLTESRPTSLAPARLTSRRRCNPARLSQHACTIATLFRYVLFALSFTLVPLFAGTRRTASLNASKIELTSPLLSESADAPSSQHSFPSTLPRIAAVSLARVCVAYSTAKLSVAASIASIASDLLVQPVTGITYDRLQGRPVRAPCAWAVYLL